MTLRPGIRCKSLRRMPGLLSLEYVMMVYDDNIRETAVQLLDKIQEIRPLVHCITNYVTVNDCANALLAVCGRPVMSHAPEEAAEITAASAALVLNMGATEYVPSMLMSGKQAMESGIPCILDPVGVPGSSYRRRLCGEWLTQIRPSVIRGNASEIWSLIEQQAGEAGVDAEFSAVEHEGSRPDSPAWIRKCSDFSERFRCVLVISGKTDLVSGDGLNFHVDNGSSLMNGVTGRGTMASALLGAFLAAGRALSLPDALSAAIGTGCMGAAGEYAYRICAEGFSGNRAESSKESGCRIGTGSFHVRLLDSLSCLPPEEMAAMLKIRRVPAE